MAARRARPLRSGRSAPRPPPPGSFAQPAARRRGLAATVCWPKSGAEAVECAIKTARRYHHAKGNPHKNTLITFANAFHGRTMATVSATDQASRGDGFAPLLEGFTVVPFDDLDAALAAVDDNTAGFLLEPVPAAGGTRPARQEFM